MPSLNSKMQLARDMFGRDEPAGERRVYGTALADSNDGTVSVDVGGEVIDVPTVGAVWQGQPVFLQVQGGHPVAIGARGAGDRIRTQLEGVTSYVWRDDLGQVHVTPAPQEDDPQTGVTINAEGVEIDAEQSYLVLEGGVVTVGANGGDVAILSGGSGTGADLIGSPRVALTAAPALSSSAPSSVQFELNYIGSSQAGTLAGVRGSATSYEAALTHAQHAGPSATELTRILDLNPSDSMASAVKAKYLEGDALKLAGKWAKWRKVSVTGRLPSGFDSASYDVWANDGLRLLRVSVYAENSGGTNVSVSANQNIFTSTDTSLYPANMSGAPVARVGSGFRYAGGALLDFPARLFQWSTSARSWGLRGPAWAFSASSVHFDAFVPYDAWGIA